MNSNGINMNINELLNNTSKHDNSLVLFFSFLKLMKILLQIKEFHQFMYYNIEMKSMHNYVLFMNINEQIRPLMQ